MADSPFAQRLSVAPGNVASRAPIETAALVEKEACAIVTTRRLFLVSSGRLVGVGANDRNPA